MYKIPKIFDFSHSWPDDILKPFLALKDPKEKIKFYCDMLRNKVDETGAFVEELVEAAG